MEGDTGTVDEAVVLSDIVEVGVLVMVPVGVPDPVKDEVAVDDDDDGIKDPIGFE